MKDKTVSRAIVAREESKLPHDQSDGEGNDEAAGSAHHVMDPAGHRWWRRPLQRTAATQGIEVLGGETGKWFWEGEWCVF